MAEQQFREIQLSGKQLVFLFMTTLVLAVVVFLLGVSVGRGARGVTAGVVEQTADVTPPDDLPPPTEMSASDLQYHDTLKQQTTPPAEPEPDPEPESAPVSAEELDQIQEPAPEATAEAEPEPAVEPEPEPQQEPEPEPPAARAEATPAPGGWQLQVGAYSSRANADRQVAVLRARDYSAFVMSDGPGNLHRVRVGPYADRAEADRAAARLLSEEGLKSSVIR